MPPLLSERLWDDQHAMIRRESADRLRARKAMPAGMDHRVRSNRSAPDVNFRVNESLLRLPPAILPPW
jgi:hypothetical protein